MSEFDIVYKAFKNYLSSTSDISEIRSFLDDMHSEGNISENLECFSTICEIDEDWVDAIHRGIPFIADAVLENRQFVRSEGEVVPIEKVKVVGKDTISDLAKHSNYITKDPEDNGGKIIPDKLMMPKKDNDFAIYENRFLYSLLVYLSQFIEIRLNDILAITGKYHATTKIVKKHASKSRNLSFELSFDETRFNDPMASQNNSSSSALDTIKECFNQTKSLLMTPLMKTVSKAPMVKAPIVKTNVFRFDHNFKESLVLFNFLQSYTKKGYTIKDVSTKISPFASKMSDHFSSLVYLTSYLTYVYGNKIEDNLKKRYEENEKKRKEEEDKRVLSEIRRIGKDIDESGLTTEQYILLLQKGHQVLERQIYEKDEELENVKKSVSEKIQSLDEEFKEDTRQKNEQFDSIVEKKANEVALQSLVKVKEFTHKNEELNSKLNSLEQQKNQLVLQNEKEKSDLVEKHQKEISDITTENSALQKDLNRQLEEAKKKIEELQQDNILLQGKVDNLRNMNGLPSEKDMTEKENFDALEKEKEAFDKYFEKTWKDTKKRIRKETLKIDKEELKKETRERKEEKKKQKEQKKDNK